jgi:hypothetical protein
VNDGQFSDLETYVLVQRYEQDSSVAYELTSDQLYKLMHVVGEMEPIIDALNVLSGATVEHRALDIGCRPEDFEQHSVGGTVKVSDLIAASKIPWQP